ncbi:MAG: hypothetical protein EXR29_15880 [Betaproteobacteria bacterium]|nr:hypothetical protein [Betaproteobacteria bacterium]
MTCSNQLGTFVAGSKALYARLQFALQFALQGEKDPWAERAEGAKPAADPAIAREFEMLSV